MAVKKEEILNEYISPKTSKYNSNIIVEECSVCSSNDNLETHHINWQKNYDQNDIDISNLEIKKNSIANLVILCTTCHDKVDRDELEIKGWIQTSNGRKLDYSINDVITKKTKHSNDLVDFIKSLKHTNDAKLVRIKVKETFDKKISTKSILNYWT